MKTVIINGSPRKEGNTSFFVNQLDESLKYQSASNEISIITANELNLKGCQACEACFKNGGNCIVDSDTNKMVSEIFTADCIIFATPVYFFGITAQLKLVLDKLYCTFGSDQTLAGKKIGLISIGGDDTASQQYTIIENQFKMAADYIKWELIFSESFSALKKGDLENITSIKEQIGNICKKLQ